VVFDLSIGDTRATGCITQQLSFWCKLHLQIQDIQIEVIVWMIKSKSKLYYDQQSVGQSVLLSGTYLGLATNFFFFFLHWQLRVSWCGASSLTRGWVCNLLYNCFWALPEQSLSGPSSAELTAIIYCLTWDSLTRRPRSPYLYPPGTGWPSYTPPPPPGHWVPFLSPLTTRRATVEVF
jgi:hypothetical protein